MKLLLNILILIFLINCSASYKELNGNNYTSKNLFNRTIIEQYKLYADFEAKEMHDWNSAKLYSEKAIKSYKGEEIKPEPIQNWRIKKDKLPELLNAYNDLMLIYKKGIKNDPKNLAIAISSLDCWAEQQEENWQINDIEECKKRFLNSIEEINLNISKNEKEKKLDTPDTAIVVAKEKKLDTSDTAIVVVVENDIIEKIIYFDFDSFEMNLKDINNIRLYILNNKNKKFIIIGHTDTKGSKEYNDKLSLKRAWAVRDLMINLGVEINQIKIIAKGENDLAVFTADEIANPDNRRVVIEPSY